MPKIKFGLLNDGYGNTITTLCQVVAENHKVQINVTNDEINKRDIVKIAGDNEEVCQRARADVEDTYQIFKFKTETCFSCGIWSQIQEFGYREFELEHDVIIIYLGRDFINAPDQDFIRIYGQTSEACQNALDNLPDIKKIAELKAYRSNEHDIDENNCYRDKLKLRFNSFNYKPNFKLFEKKFKVRIELIEDTGCYIITIIGNSDKDVQHCKRKLQRATTLEECRILLEQKDKKH